MHACLSINQFSVINANQATGNLGVINSLVAVKNNSREEALFDIFKVLRPGEPPTLEAVSYTHLTLPTKRIV